MPSRRATLVCALVALTVPASAQGIVNGTPATGAGSTVRLQVTRPAGTSNCTGSLIGPSVVLTAAHCVTGVTAITVIAGRDDLTNTALGRTFDAVRWRAAPQAGPSSHDLAYVDLGQESTAPVAPLLNFVPAAGVVLHTRGYGQTIDGVESSTRLREGDVKTAMCPAGIPAAASCTRVVPGYPAGPCRGDSGGPVLTTQGLLIGVLSAASAGCQDYTTWSPVARDIAFLADARAPRVTGRITSVAGGGVSPLAGRIRVLRQSGSVAATATTDDRGGFQLALPTGVYDVEATAPGHVTRTVQDLVVDRPRVVDAGLAETPRAKARLLSVTRRRSGTLAVRVRVTPPAGVTVTLGVQGVTVPAKGTARSLGTPATAKVARTGTITVVLRPGRAARAKVKAGTRVRIGVFAGDDLLAIATLRIRKG